MIFDNPHYNHAEAVELGCVYKATILQYVRWSVSSKQAGNNQEYYRQTYFHDDVWWMQDSQEAWLKRFPMLSESTLQRYFNELCDRGYLSRRRAVVTWGRQPNFYRALDRSSQIDSALTVKMEDNICQNDSYVSVKMTATSLSNNQAHNHAKPSPPPIMKFDFEDRTLGKEWLQYAMGEMKWKRPNASWTEEKFATELAKVRKAANMDHDQMRFVFEFIKKDKFWQDKALSPSSLLKKNAAGDRKIDNILLQATKNERKHDRLLEMLNSDDPF